MNSATDLQVGFYEAMYEIASTEEVDIMQAIREHENANIGYISNIKMELYPVTGSYFYINGKKLKTFDGTYTSPPDLEIESLKIIPVGFNTTFSIIYYYYL